MGVGALASPAFADSTILFHIRWLVIEQDAGDASVPTPIHASPAPTDICRPNGGKGGVGTREERRWGGDPCGRPRPGGLIRPGGTQDTHKGPPIHPSPPVSLRFGASRASSLARHSPFRVAKFIRTLGRKRPMIPISGCQTSSDTQHLYRIQYNRKISETGVHIHGCHINTNRRTGRPDMVALEKAG